MAKAQPNGIEVPSGTPPEMAEQLDRIQQNFEDIYRQLPEGSEESEFAAGSLAGRGSAAGAGPVEEVTLGTGLSMDGTTLNVTVTAGEVSGYYAPLTDGDEVETELIFADGECIMVEVSE